MVIKLEEEEAHILMEPQEEKAHILRPQEEEVHILIKPQEEEVYILIKLEEEMNIIIIVGNYQQDKDIIGLVVAIIVAIKEELSSSFDQFLDTIE